MNNFIDQLIVEFKRMKHIRGNLFENFLTFSHLYLTGVEDDKYKVKKNQILEHIVVNKQSIKLRLIQN
tara:strand:- start:507 stop:710 length:204 start_codon:yes stop_codon:yes gene_type:complete